MQRDDASEASYSSWTEGGGGSVSEGGGGSGMREGRGRYPHGAATMSPADLSRELNRQITQASSMEELVHVVVVNFNQLNAVNLCTAYHRIARHVQDTRNPLERWPPQQQAQLGGLLSRINYALIPMLDQVQAQNLGITLWSMSKVQRLQQTHAGELIEALQREVVNRLHNVTPSVYMTDKHYKFGPQSLSNIIYSAASMGIKLDYDLLHQVAKAIGWQIEEFKPQGLANTLWSLGKLGIKLTFEVRQLVDVCCGEMYNQLAHQRYKGTYAPQNISNALHGLAKLGYLPTSELLAELAKCAGQQLRHFGPQEITNMVWGFAQLYSNGATLPPDVNALIDRIADELSLYFQDRQWRTRVKPQTISNMTWAYAKLKRCPQKLNQDMIREMLQILPQFKPQELSNVLWALATMNHYPGSSVIDSIVQATCHVIQDMKPQEVSNTVWALATLRHFPGTTVLDTYIHHSAGMLERFKSQEIGNLMWALARLGYMPAAGFALAVMPYIQSWRQSDVQDCGNLLWAFMILDVLTPEAVQLLGDRLCSMPPQQFTQESYIQIYQAKMAMSQKVATIAQHIPPELLRQAELEWRQQSFHNRISKTHREVSETLSALGEPHELERRIEDGLLSVDLALTDRMVAVEVDGSSHFSSNEPFVPLGKSVLRWRMLASRGWKVVTVPYYRWAVLRTTDERKEYLWRLLQCESVWDCLSVDPNNRDAPRALPVNMAHITPDDVIAHMGPGDVMPTFPEALLPQATSPVSTLLGMPQRPGSTHSTPTGPGLMGPPPSAYGRGVNGQLPGLVPRGQPSLGSLGGGDLRRPSGFGSPFSTASGPSGGEGPGASRLGQQGGGRAGGGVALPDSLYSTGGGMDSRPSGTLSSGLSVTAKPFTMGSLANPSLGGGQQWGDAGSGGGSGSGSGAPTPRSASMLSPPVPPPLHAPYPAGPTGHGGGGFGSYQSLPPPSSSSLQRPPMNSVSYPPGGRPAGPSGGGFITPGQSPTATSMLPLLPHGMSAPVPGSAQTMSSLGPARGDVSDDEIDDLRSYFAQVTGVAPVAPVQEGPLSVEEAVMRVLALPSDRPASDLATCFTDWDAVRFGQLLRALAGQATAVRATQLFDWARGLPADHPQAGLCCPATYATMMELHGGWRQPGKALRLLSDAKARGLELGADIYSALVQALCKCEQYEVAMDAFQHMLTQGLQVEGAVFHCVLTAQLDRLAWGEVQRLLEEMKEHGAEVDVDMFNLVLERAAKAGEKGLVLAAYERMCEAGVAPTPDTFATLISVQLQSNRGTEELAETLLGLVDQAPAGEQVEASQQQPAAGEQALVALLRACRAAGLWQLARLLLRAAPEHGVPPCLSAANEVIAACGGSGAVEEAQAVFDGLAAAGLEPDASSYGNLVEAYHHAGQWVQAAKVYEAMLAAGHEPTLEQHSAVIGGLWESGTPWGQAKANELFEAATSSGGLPRPTVTPSRGIVKVDLNAVDAGTGTLSLYHWLVQLREGIGNTNLSGVLDEHRRLVVVNGSSASTPQGAVAPKLKGAVGSSLVTHKSPFRLSTESGRASRLEASTQMVKRWLFTETFQGWARLFSGEEALSGTSLTLNALPSAADWAAHEEQLRDECHRMFSIVRVYEATHSLEDPAMPMPPETYRSRRRGLVMAAYEFVNTVLALPSAAQVWHAATVLLDRLGRQDYTPLVDEVMAAACVVLAGAKEGISVDIPTLGAGLNYQAVLEATGFEPAAALESEVATVGSMLGGDTACISPIHCWKVYADRLGVATDNAVQVKAVLGDSYYTLNNLITDDFTLKYAPSVQAAAVVCVARKQAGVVPFWPSVLRDLTGYDETHPKFADAVGEFEKPVSYGTVVSAAVFS